MAAREAARFRPHGDLGRLRARARAQSHPKDAQVLVALCVAQRTPNSSGSLFERFRCYQTGLRLDDIDRFTLVKAQLEASFIGAGKLDLVAVAQLAFRRLHFAHQRLCRLSLLAADAHELFDNVRALCRKLLLISNLHPGAASAHGIIGAGRLHARGAWLNDLDDLRFAEALSILRDVHRDHIARHARTNKHGFSRTETTDRSRALCKPS